MKSCDYKYHKLMFYICIVLLCSCGIYAGLADNDYYWQAYLGGQELLHGNFYASNNLFWGSKDIHTYYDHEWLCNIIFYVFSLIKIYPILFLKFFICILTALQIHRYIEVKNYEFDTAKRFIFLAFVFLYSMLFIKVKAYSFSVLFLMEELMILYKYEHTDKKKIKYCVYMILLTVLWTNFHSGSMPLLFVVAGLFWVVKLRDIRTILYGVICVLSTLINPYGYKLLLFNFQHNNDKLMKNIVRDWTSVDGKTELGILMLMLLIVMFILIYARISVDVFTLVLFLAIFSLGFSSGRHYAYMLPVFIELLYKSNLSIKIDYNLSWYFITVSIILFSSCYISAMRENIDDYNAVISSDDKLIAYLDSTVGRNNEGYFTDCFFVRNRELAYKEFVTGAFPACKERNVASYLLCESSGYDTKSKIIDYYDLNKFLVYTHFTNGDNLVVKSSLYEYLSSNENYYKLFDNGYVAYFVSDSVYNDYMGLLKNDNLEVLVE